MRYTQEGLRLTFASWKASAEGKEGFCCSERAETRELCGSIFIVNPNDRTKIAVVPPFFFFFLFFFFHEEELNLIIEKVIENKGT